MFVLDRTLNTSHILSANKNSQSAFWEDTYTQEFDTGAESFEFSCYTHESIKEGNYVAFFYNNQYKMFQIIEVQEVHKKGRLVSECYCEIASLQLLNNYVKPFSGDMNCIQFFQHILHGTEWHIGKYSTSLENVVYTVNEKNIESVWALIEDYKDIYGCEINVRVTYDNGHVTGQYIDIYAEGGLGSSTLKRFEYGRNVTGITKTKDLYDWCTGIILDVDCDVSNTIIEERDGYGFTKGAGDVILDDNANRMYNAGRTHVIGVYQGKETEPVEACINAWKELQKRKEPKFDYKVTTALKDEEYEDIHLGDTVYVVDHSYTPPLLLEARVGKLELSFTDRTQNSCTLTNYKEIKSKLLDADYIKLTGTISDVVNAFFPITSEGIADGAIVDGKIETTYFQQITADIVSAGIGAFENLYAQGMTVINADIENLKATSADITDLKAQVAEIDTLINGHLTSDNIQSLILTSDKVTVEDAFIKDAMIDSITANKITSGSINTNNVYISSEDGSMIINGNLQQFKDKYGNVRIQIGKDSQGDFTFSLFDEFGTGVLIDEKGITENAIADGLIVNDMVAEDAGIAGSKLDIDSVVTEINEGTTTIKGTKVVVDDNNQTLDMAFSSLKSRVESFAGVEDTNLLKNTAFEDGMDYWIPNNALWTIINDDSDSPLPWMTARRLKLKAFIHYGDVIQKVDLVHGTTYTVSYWIKGDVGGTIVLAVLCYDDNGISYEKGRETIAMTGEYQKIEVTFTSSNKYTKHGIRFAFTYDTASYTGACEVYMGMAKLEEGSVATDWVAPSMSLVEMVQANTTAINVQQGQIDTLISNTTITKENGEVVQLKDEYNSTKDTVDSHTTKIGSLETTIDSVSSKQASMELDLDGFRTEVSNTYVTKEELDLTNYNLINNGKFENCYAGTYDMIPSWECDDELQVYDIPSNSSRGWIKLFNRTSELGLTKSIQQRVNLEDGEIYTLTFKAGWQENVNGGVMCYIGYYDSSDSRIHTISVPIENQMNSADELQTFTFTTPINLNYEYIVLKFRIGDTVNSGGNYIYASIGDVKLEKGDTYTGWRGSKKDEAIIIEGQNLVQNGDFSSFTLPRTIDGWKIGGDGVIWDLTGQEPYNKEGCIYFAHIGINDVYSGFYQNVRNLKRRTEYTLTFYIDWEFNVYNFYADLAFIGRDGNVLFTIDLKPPHAGTWSYTFVTPDIDFGHMNVGFCHRGIKELTGNGILGIAGNVKLTENVTVEDLSTVLSNYTTKTEFEQTNEDFTFKIQQSGGYNLLKNSAFTNGTEYWTKLCWDGTHTASNNLHVMEAYRTWNNNHFAGLEYLATVSQPQGFIRGGFDSSYVYNLEPGAKYSFSCYASCGRVDELVIELCGTDWNSQYQNWGVLWRGAVGANTREGINYEGWTKIEFTFTAPNAYCIFLRFWGNNHTEGDLATSLMISQPCLVRGSIPLDWSPHPSEIYDGIVKIDSRGLTVQQGNNKSVLDSEALNFYAGDVRYSRVRGGKIEFTNSDGSVIGDLGKSTWVDTNIGLSSVNARYGHSSALGAQYGSSEAYTAPLIVCSKDGKLTNNGGHYFQGLNLSSPKVSGALTIRGSAHDTVELELQGMMIYANYGNGYRVGNIFGNEELHLGTQYGLENWDGLIIKENGANNSKNELHAYGHLNMHNYNIGYAGWVNPVSATTTYTTRLLNEGSIENMTYGGNTFTEGELRYVHRETCHTVEEWDYNDEGVWSPLGVYYCYCELPIFMAENIELDYHVNIGKIGWGDYRVIEKNPYLFIVESQEEGFAFTWEVVAKQVEKAKNNAVVANNYVDTGRNQVIPTEDSDFTYELDKEELIEEEEELQENINIGEE